MELFVCPSDCSGSCLEPPQGLGFCTSQLSTSCRNFYASNMCSTSCPENVSDTSFNCRKFHNSQSACVYYFDSQCISLHDTLYIPQECSALLLTTRWTGLSAQPQTGLMAQQPTTLVTLASTFRGQPVVPAKIMAHGPVQPHSWGSSDLQYSPYKGGVRF